jgi:hypothetical protein
MNANGAGSSGGETAPPDEVLPRMTKNSHVGTIAQRPSSTAISEVKVAQRQPPGLREDLEDGDEADDRADQHAIEEVEAVRVPCCEWMGVDDAHGRIDTGDPLQHSGHGRAGRARHVQSGSRGLQVEGGVDALLIDRMQSASHRRVAADVELPARHLLHRVDGARVGGRVADERRVDAARHGVAQRERVGDDEEATHDDRDERDHGGPLCRRPLALPQAPEA